MHRENHGEAECRARSEGIEAPTVLQTWWLAVRRFSLVVKTTLVMESVTGSNPVSVKIAVKHY